MQNNKTFVNDDKTETLDQLKALIFRVENMNIQINDLRNLLIGIAAELAGIEYKEMN